MGMPSDDLTVVSLDAGTDDPSQARVELLAALNKIKALIQAYNVVNGLCPLDASGKVPAANLSEPSLAALSAAVNTAKGAPVASAATTNIWSTAGNFIHVTGTTTITSLGSAPQAGAWRIVQFDSALTLTHNASSLVLPGAANLLVAAGSIMLFVADTATMISLAFSAGAAATSSQAGIAELALQAEVAAGDATRIVTGATLVSLLSGVAKRGSSSFSTAGAWSLTVGSSTRHVAVTINGAAGGAGGNKTWLGGSSAGGAGGRGGYTTEYYTISPGATLSGTIGAGGTDGIDGTNPTNGTAGSATTCTQTGQTAAGGGGGTAATNPDPGTTGTSGAASGGDTNTTGGSSRTSGLTGYVTVTEYF